LRFSILKSIDMHTIVAFSDAHGAPLPQKLLQVASEADYVLYLGDGINGLGEIMLHKGLHAVSGNCDIPCFPQEEVLELDGVRMLLTHGHKYNVKRDLLNVALRAKELDCAAVFYGHTHLAAIDDMGGVTLVCPGSPCYTAGAAASYAYAVVHQGKLTVKIVNIS